MFNLGFPGQYRDVETGTNYNYFRNYNPGLGGYVEPDPIGLRGGVNIYAYVRGNPVSKIDRVGLETGLPGMPWPGINPYSNMPVWCTCPDPPVMPKPKLMCPAQSELDKNIEQAKAHYGNIVWFYNQVRNKGPWDYKQQDSSFQDFGNFNFGATGTALGIPSEVLQRGAGWAQQQAGTSNPAWGGPSGSYPYGDDPDDNWQIRQGIKYPTCNCGK